ncbi:MAG: transcriptional regulator, partial [Syntrophobacterales bacterium]
TAEAIGLSVIEAAAQAIGASDRAPAAGAFGHYGCFSFFPSKNLGGFGDGGIVTTPSADAAEKLRVLRVHGTRRQYYHEEIGGNFRLDALQAAVISIKLRSLDRWTEKRRRNASVYRRLFQECDLAKRVTAPPEKQGRHVYNQFVIRVEEKRDELKAFLQERGVGTAIYYPLPLHLQHCFRSLGYGEGDFPVAEHAAAHTLALPIFPELTDAQIEYVVDCIRRFYLS